MVPLCLVYCNTERLEFQRIRKSSAEVISWSSQFGHRRNTHNVVLHVFWDCLQLGDHRKKHTDELQHDIFFSWAQRQIKEILLLKKVKLINKKYNFYTCQKHFLCLVLSTCHICFAPYVWKYMIETGYIWIHQINMVIPDLDSKRKFSPCCKSLIFS